MKKERLFYLDFVRAIAALAIVITHFNARYLYLNPPAPEKAVFTTSIGNLYIGDWGVSLFFIISGAALMYVYEEKCQLKTFYKKRFLSIYPMFWIAYITDFLFIVWQTHTMPGGGIPKWRILFSVIGFDGLLLTNGYPTFYLLGEWFLGVIVLIYLVFPLLRALLNKKPVLLLILTAAGYAGGLVLCTHVSYPLVPATLLFVRIPELVFGMFFVKYKGKVTWKTAALALAVVLVNWTVKPGFTASIQTTYVGIASFLVCVYVSNIVRCAPVEYICEKLSKYSYAVFLVHHVIIAKIMGKFNLMEISVGESYLLFMGVCCVIALFAWILYLAHYFVMRGIVCMKQKVKKK